MSYSELATRLNKNGASESYASIANKISRGTFSFAFYLQCVSVLEPTCLTSTLNRSPAYVEVVDGHES